MKKWCKLVTDLIEETNPSLVISFYPGLAVHPDHDATARAVVRAVRRMPETERPTVYTLAFANNTVEVLGEPDVIHDVTANADKKMATLKAHASQTVWMMKEMEKKLEALDPEALKWLIMSVFIRIAGIRILNKYYQYYKLQSIQRLQVFFIIQ